MSPNIGRRRTAGPGPARRASERMCCQADALFRARSVVTLVIASVGRCFVSTQALSAAVAVDGRRAAVSSRRRGAARGEMTRLFLVGKALCSVSSLIDRGSGPRAECRRRERRRHNEILGERGKDDERGGGVASDVVVVVVVDFEAPLSSICCRDRYRRRRSR